MEWPLCFARPEIVTSPLLPRDVSILHQGCSKSESAGEDYLTIDALAFMEKSTFIICSNGCLNLSEWPFPQSSSDSLDATSSVWTAMALIALRYAKGQRFRWDIGWIIWGNLQLSNFIPSYHVTLPEWIWGVCPLQHIWEYIFAEEKMRKNLRITFFCNNRHQNPCHDFTDGITKTHFFEVPAFVHYFLVWMRMICVLLYHLRHIINRPSVINSAWKLKDYVMHFVLTMTTDLIQQIWQWVQKGSPLINHFCYDSDNSWLKIILREFLVETSSRREENETLQKSHWRHTGSWLYIESVHAKTTRTISHSHSSFLTLTLLICLSIHWLTTSSSTSHVHFSPPLWINYNDSFYKSSDALNLHSGYNSHNSTHEKHPERLNHASVSLSVEISKRSHLVLALRRGILKR